MHDSNPAPRPKVLAYYFPDWHVDPRNEQWFGPGWTEWELVKAAGPRFDGHSLPRVPRDGYVDEADPEVAAKQIDLARRNGIDGFLVDYYWYDDGGYLNRALDDGLLGAANTQDMTFALMWANHELVDIFPLSEPRPEAVRQLKAGSIDRPAFERMAKHVIEHYFSRDNYLKVDGKPWFSVYEVGGLIKGLGGVKQTADALRWFREQTVLAGHPGLHLDIVVWGFAVLPTGIAVPDPGELIDRLGFESATSYVWVHHVDIASFDFPRASVPALRQAVFAEYEKYAQFKIPFYPNVTVGWDSSARTDQARSFERGRYPWFPIWEIDPDEFRKGLEAARDFLSRHQPEFPVVTINAWNEWTEGSYLLPDTQHGDAVIRSVLGVFGPIESHSHEPRDAGERA
ncbi:glycoside hydrolase family 99-like domain-containing protein [Microbacterium lacus]|uniref:Glycoside hydrolase family 99-like domain-containing protein n=1 Tax=Microbacterium lacus TaxID=415217 RepID=A0ABN2FX61_9MICO